MLDKLDAIKARFEQVGIALTNPEIINNQKEYGAMSKEYRSLEKIVQPYETYRRVMADYEFAKESLNGSDEDMRELAKMELPELELKKDELEKALTKLLIPKDPQDDKNAILEIRAGTGGDEASLFAGDLLGMYLRYCSKKGWKTNIVTESEGTVGGYKEVVVEVTGEDVYGTLKFESGVHRVQRVPNTETQGRVHTSAATVAVMPEAEERKQGRNQGILNAYSNRGGSGLSNRAFSVGQPRKSHDHA
jgi:peptide chain release factor 1